MEIPEFDQTPGDILQEQESYEIKTMPIETVICEPVRSITLPTKKTTFYTAGSVGVQLLGRDPRRASATIIGLSQDIRLGSTQAEAVSGGRVPAVVPISLTGMGEIWATAVASTTDITVIAEYWAD
jgi:hypothetical protein